MKLLSNDSLFGKTMTFIGTLVGANLLFLLFSLPVVTAGASYTALYYTLFHLLRKKELNPFTTFWNGVRDNWKQATVVWLAVLALIAFFAADFSICHQMTGALRLILYPLGAIAIAVGAVVLLLFPVLAVFEDRLPKLVQHSLFFACGHLPTVLLVAVVEVVPLLLTYLQSKWLPLFAFLWTFIGFALTTFAGASMLLRVFAKYRPEFAPEEQHFEQNSKRQTLADMKRLGM